jgi:hypothetical protein
MVRLGSDKRPAVATVKTQKRGEEIMKLCNEHGWKVIVEIESNKPEDTSDVDRLLNPRVAVTKSQQWAAMTLARAAVA